MEFADLGAHCAVESCNLRDFLPFHCDCCERQFCLDHRTYHAHNCQHEGRKQQICIKCPLCAQTLKLTAAQDPNIVWQEHHLRDCDPSKKKKKLRCAVKGCKEVMGPSNIHVCSACGVKVCLRHRYDKEDHSCTGKKGGGPGRGVASWFGIGGSGGAGAGGGGGGGHTHSSNSASATTPKTAPPTRSASNSSKRPTGGGQIRAAPPVRSAAETAQALRATADRRKQQGGGGGNAGYPGAYQQQQQSVSEVVDLTGDDTPPATATATSTAAAAAAPGMNVDGGCPFCLTLFTDPVALVAHVEAVHQHEQRLQGAGGEGESSCCVG